MKNVFLQLAITGILLAITSTEMKGNTVPDSICTLMCTVMCTNKSLALYPS